MVPFPEPLSQTTPESITTAMSCAKERSRWTDTTPQGAFRPGKRFFGEDSLPGETPLSCRIIWEGNLPGVSGICEEESYREKYPTGRHPARGDGFGITGQTWRRKRLASPPFFFGVASSWLLAFVLCVAPECCAGERSAAGG